MIRHLALVGVLFAVVAAATAQESLQADADRMAAKLAFILDTGERPRGKDAPLVRTSFTDQEINSYFKVYGPTFLPDGVTNPQFGIGDRGQIAARAIVDLDAVRKSRERGWLDPMAYVTGSLEVTAVGMVVGSNGTGTFEFESATVAGLSVPKGVLQELVRFYTTTPEMPNGFDLGEPFELPASIRSVVTERGRATIVQ